MLIARPIVRHAVALYVAALAATPALAQEQTWQLSPIVGDASGHWASEPNWTWNDGNPMTQRGATWRLAAQLIARPELNARHSDMVQGLYVNFTRVWLGDKQQGADPPNQYRAFALWSRNSSREPGAGPASVLMFRPDAAGDYRLQLSARVVVQNKTAGFARVTIYSLSADESKGEQIKHLELNQEGGFDAANKPDKLALDEPVSLKAGQWLAVRVQGVNPGPAPVGTVGLDFDTAHGGQFTITAEAR